MPNISEKELYTITLTSDEEPEDNETMEVTHTREVRNIVTQALADGWHPRHIEVRRDIVRAEIIDSKIVDILAVLDIE